MSKKWQKHDFISGNNAHRKKNMQKKYTQKTHKQHDQIKSSQWTLKTIWNSISVHDVQ